MHKRMAQDFLARILLKLFPAFQFLGNFPVSTPYPIIRLKRVLSGQLCPSSVDERSKEICRSSCVGSNTRGVGMLKIQTMSNKLSLFNIQFKKTVRVLIIFDLKFMLYIDRCMRFTTPLACALLERNRMFLLLLLLPQLPHPGLISQGDTYHLHHNPMILQQISKFPALVINSQGYDWQELKTCMQEVILHRTILITFTPFELWNGTQREPFSNIEN